MVVHGLFQKACLDARSIARYRLLPSHGGNGWLLWVVCPTGKTVVASFTRYGSGEEYLLGKMPLPEGVTDHIDRSARALISPRQGGQG